jgi:hypothetical protein
MTALFTLLMLAGTAHSAVLYHYSYSLGSGTVITGSFTGDASGNLVTNLADISVFINGNPFSGNGSLLEKHRGPASAFSVLSGGAQASFDGSDTNFYFVDAADTNFFAIASGVAGFGNMAIYVIDSPFTFGQDCINCTSTYDAARWSLTAAVPEPGTIALLGLGLLMAGMVRRRRP